MAFFRTANGSGGGSSLSTPTQIQVSAQQTVTINDLSNNFILWFDRRANNVADFSYVIHCINGVISLYGTGVGTICTDESYSNGTLTFRMLSNVMRYFYYSDIE